jgi:undecaprenyl-diphosphatase
MSLIEAIILGIVQGLTEFLPVSSSGHLQIMQHIMHVNEGGLTFDVTVHVATVLATLLILRKEILDLIKGFFRPLAPSDGNNTLWQRLNDQQKYIVLIIISMIPVGIVGLCFKDYVEAIFEGSIIVVGVCLIATALLLALTHYYKPQPKEKISPLHAFIIGIAQAVAVLPGLSRSGSTIATGLLLGNKKETLAQFSFLMVIPPILGEALLEIKHIIAPSEEYIATHADALVNIPTAALVAGFIAAFISGCFACKWMIQMVKKCKLIYFSIYCLIAAILCFVIA